MKSKSLILFSVLGALSLSACATGQKHDIGEYILEVDYKDNFKILQLTDIHLGDKDDKQLHYDFMDLTIKQANPDMIIVTGDLFTFASRNTAKSFFNFLDSHNVPWTVTFGNHDEQCYFSVDWMTGYLNNFGSHCVFKDIQDDNVKGNANFAINLMQGGNVFEQLIIMDSNRYHYGSYNGYDYFDQSQIDWYEELVNHSKVGGNPVESLMFYHIPLPEVNDAYDYGVENGSLSGEEREKTCPPDYNSGFFSKIVELGSTKAMFFGHDHVNNFRVTYQGVTFNYGVKSTDRIYYDEDMTGGELITLKNDHSLEYEYIYHKYSEVR